MSSSTIKRNLHLCMTVYLFYCLTDDATIIFGYILYVDLDRIFDVTGDIDCKMLYCNPSMTYNIIAVKMSYSISEEINKIFRITRN